MFNGVTNMIRGRRYIFKSNVDKREMINGDLSVEEIIKIINVMSTNFRSEELNKIFNSEYYPNISTQEKIEIFKHLSYNDRVNVIKNKSYSSFKESLIKIMPHYELIRYLMSELANGLTGKFMISLLSPIERRLLYYFPLTNMDACIEIKKYSSPSSIEAFLKHKFGYNIRISVKDKLGLLACLSDDKKLACLEYPNEFNLKLDNSNKKELLNSLSDQLKMKFINGTKKNRYRIKYF